MNEGQGEQAQTTAAEPESGDFGDSAFQDVLADDAAFQAALDEVMGAGGEPESRKNAEPEGEVAAPSGEDEKEGGPTEGVANEEEDFGEDVEEGEPEDDQGADFYLGQWATKEEAERGIRELQQIAEQNAQRARQLEQWAQSIQSMVVPQAAQPRQPERYTPEQFARDIQEAKTPEALWNVFQKVADARYQEAIAPRAQEIEARVQAIQADLNRRYWEQQFEKYPFLVERGRDLQALVSQGTAPDIAVRLLRAEYQAEQASKKASKNDKQIPPPPKGGRRKSRAKRAKHAKGRQTRKMPTPSDKSSQSSPMPGSPDALWEEALREAKESLLSS